MLISIDHKAGLLAGVLVSSLVISFASTGYAQSADKVSDDDYLSALSTMSADMDLTGLASQTFEPVTVIAPQLPAVVGAASAVLCNTLRAQAEESGNSFVILASDATLSASELATLSKCVEQGSGLLVSYVLPTS